MRAAVRALRHADGQQLESALTRMGVARSWLTPLVFAAATMGSLFDGLMLLLRNRRLLLVEVIPAVWIGATVWDLRVHSNGSVPLAHLSSGWNLVVIGGILVMSVTSLWCNLVFALCLEQGDDIADLRRAMNSARRFRTPILGWGLATGVSHAFVSVILSQAGVAWFSIGLTVVVGIQIYTLTIVPANLAGIPSRGYTTLKERASATTTGLAVGAVAALPAFVLIRVGSLLLGLGVLRWVGFAILAVAVLVQVSTVSTVRAVKTVAGMKSAQPSGEAIR